MMAGSLRGNNRWKFQDGRCSAVGFEREQIRVGIEREESFAQIARSLGRVTSTVSREVGGVAGRAGYCAVTADRVATRQRCRGRPTKLAANPALADERPHLVDAATAYQRFQEFIDSNDVHCMRCSD